MGAIIEASESRLGQEWIDLPQDEFIELYGEPTFEYFEMMFINYEEE